ncbi:MAG: hypothetical protein ACREXY_06135 [Gammaproteobacteria bacterium]
MSKQARLDDLIKRINEWELMRAKATSACEKHIAGEFVRSLHMAFTLETLRVEQ